MENEKIIAELQKDLPVKHVKHRDEKWGTLDYVESWYCIDTANKIFGFDGWSQEIVDLVTVDESQKNGKYYVTAEARVRITPKGFLSREDVGYGQGISKDLGSALESAGKEAVSDATKRTLRTYGYRFGLALYDKKRDHVDGDDTAESAPVNIEPVKNYSSEVTAVSEDDLLALIEKIGNIFDENTAMSLSPPEMLSAGKCEYLMDLLNSHNAGKYVIPTSKKIVRGEDVIELIKGVYNK